MTNYSNKFYLRFTKFSVNTVIYRMFIEMKIFTTQLFPANGNTIEQKIIGTIKLKFALKNVVENEPLAQRLYTKKVHVLVFVKL